MELVAVNTESKLSNSDRNFLRRKVLELIETRAQNKFSILVTGKTGVGKSRLVNGLVGEPGAAEEGRERTRGKTDRVQSYGVFKNGIEVLVWDSPGLQDRTVLNEHLYLEEVMQHGFDAMIYCCRMDIKRFLEEDKMAMRTLTSVFGKEVWKKAVVALTFANSIEDPDGGDEKVYFQGELNHWKDAINGFLGDVCDARIPPIVPAGNYRRLILPTSENWLAELWISCFCAMDVDASLAFFQINRDRVSFEGGRTNSPAEPDTTQGGSSRALAIQSAVPSIVLNRRQERRFWGKLIDLISEFVEEHGPILAAITAVGAVLLIGLLAI